MWRIWAVARHMIAEAIRMKVALIFIVLIVALLPILPFVVAGDGVTLTSRVQSFLAYSLGAVTFFLSILTLFLACGGLSGEIQNKQIFMIVSKPIPRWHFFLGKWLGIVVLDAALLGIAGLIIWGFTYYLSGGQATLPGDKERLNAEILTARAGSQVEMPDFSVAADNWVRQRREDGAFDDLNEEEIKARRREYINQLQNNHLSLPGGQYRTYRFAKNLIVDRDAPGFLQLRFKPISATGIDDEILQLMWQAGDPNNPDTMTNTYTGEYITDRFHTLVIPNYAINKQGELYVHLANVDPYHSFTFPDPDSIEILYSLGTFHWNLFRALCVILCRLAFIAVLGLLASSFLSFPVACTLCFLVLLVAISADYVQGSMEWAQKPQSFLQQMFWGIGTAIQMITRTFVWIVPDFSRHDPIGNMINGRVVPMKWIAVAFTELVVIKGTILGVLGMLVFSKRELAQVTV